jgi:enamine deaminase RidA (YjgF/YER057c/UK114 family)
MPAESRLTELGISLPTAPRPMASYVTSVRTANLVFTSGHGPSLPDGSVITGKVGVDLDLEAGQEAARVTGLNLLATLRDELGSLDRVSRVVKVLGMVNCPPDFTHHPEVINGCSNLFVDVFGDAGRHARSAVGMGSLPRNIAVEIEVVVEVG